MSGPAPAPAPAPAPLLAPGFFFRWAFPCQRVDPLPATNGDRLVDLPAACRLPSTDPIEGRSPWATVAVGWNAAGLGIVVESASPLSPLRFEADEPGAWEQVQIWVDTRDTRDIHRASKYCHRFAATLRPEGRSTAIRTTVRPRAIARAQASPPAPPEGSIQARAERLKKGWRLELFLGAAALYGYDPETNRRLGFLYRLFDPACDDQFLGVGRDFPIGDDPSLWATLELVGDEAPRAGAGRARPRAVR